MGSNGSQRLTLKVEGMDCANCALGITRKLSKSGDHDVYVDFTTGEASFHLGQYRKIQQAVTDIEDLGYKVVGEHSHSAETFFTLNRKFWFCLVFAVPLMLPHILPHVLHVLESPWVQLTLCIPVFLVGAWHFGRSAWNSLRSGVPNMDVLIIIGVVASFAYSIAGMALYSDTGTAHDYLFFETTASIVTLVLLGNLLEQRSVRKTSSAIDDLASLMPEKARRIVRIGQSEREEMISPDLLHPGDIVQVNSGENFPADGIVISGSGSVNESMISGESTPVDKSVDSPVVAGSVVLDGPIRLRVTETGLQSTLSRIIEMVKAAQRERPPVQKLADKISAWFVPVVLIISAGTFLVEYFMLAFTMSDAVMNAIAVLVISCPCAMGLATPTAVMVGIGRAAKNGILIRSGAALEELGKAQIVVFDKTGTLTTGQFKQIEIQPRGGTSPEHLRSVLFSLEKHSSHPLAKSIVSLLDGTPVIELNRVIEQKGFGISGFDRNDNFWRIGSWRWAGDEGTKHDLYICCNSEIVGTADLNDEIKEGAKQLVEFLHSKNIRTVLLSGDRLDKCQRVAAELGITEVFAQHLPEEKLERIASLSVQGTTVMIGDGVNDAPALAKASVGLSLSDASSAAINSAQVIVPGQSNLANVKTAVLIGTHSMRTIKQNLFWAFFYNAVAIPLAAAGFLTPMVAALSMAFSDVIVIGNSLLLRTKKLK